MILQNPSILWGLLLLVIPIIVHLFDFRRIKKIQFSNVAFLQTIQKQNTPRRRLKDLLILLSRLLALAFLILAFSRPILPAENSNFSTNTNLLVIDQTRSMDGKCEDFSCLEAAKIASVEAAKAYGQGQFFNQGTNRFKRFISADELAQQLDPLELSKEKFSLNFEKDVLVGGQITVLSDFQPDVIEEVVRLAADSIPILLIPMATSSVENLYVDSVFLKNPFSIGDNKRILGVRVANAGDNIMESALVRIYNDQNQLSSAALTVGANSFETIFFEIENSYNPIYRVEVEDFETDFDNSYFFVIPNFEPIKIAILGGKKSRPIEAIFQNTDYFDLEVYSSSSIDFERFFSSDLVILHSLDQIPEWFDIGRLAGELVVVPTSTADIANYSLRLGFRITQSADSVLSPLKASGFEHPFFDGLFDDLDSKASFPKVMNIYNAPGAGEGLLFSDQPFLQRLQGESKIYWFNSPLEEGFSELQNHALFLPIMYRIAEDSKGFNEPIAYPLSNSPLQINLEHASSDLIELKGSNGQFVPSSYFNQSTLIFTLPDELNDPGFYYLTSGSDTLRVIALNINRNESALNGLNSEELRVHFDANPNIRVLETGSQGSLQSSLSELSGGKKLWKYALVLAILFLVVETTLHRWLT